MIAMSLSDCALSIAVLPWSHLKAVASNDIVGTEAAN